MTLELNCRMICRKTGEITLLFDPDTKKTVTMNRSGLVIYELIRKYSDCETVLEKFAGNDPAKRRDAENFLAMLQKSGCLAGFNTGAEIQTAVPKSTVKNPGIGVGFSMHGTFESGDKLEIRDCDISKLRRGDVIRFTDHTGKSVGHRIIGGRNGRWITMGDNNDKPDRRFVTAENDPQLITGRTHNGRYYPVKGGRAGMRHFYCLRVRRAVIRGSRKIIKAAAVPFVNCFFWRRKPDKCTDFGKTRQYSCGGRVIGWRINGNAVYARQVLRLFYRLPEN